jgi:GNAT superfamily N-acetyltransferase
LFVNLTIRALTLAGKIRALLPGAVDLQPVHLDRDWEQIDRLLRMEQWPFVRADLELGDAQPGETSFVARKHGQFAAFFTAHMFGEIGYLDMLVIHPDFRGRKVARPLYFKVMEALRRAGARGLVVHTTNDSARIIRILGFTPGRLFTLRTRPPGPAPAGPKLEPASREQFMALDAEIFGMARPAWTGWLASDPRIELVAVGDAIAALRPRVDNGWSIDHILARNPDDLAPLVDGVLARHGATSPLMAFAATDGLFEGMLAARGFLVPDFFVPIGPLTEWRQGETGSVGRSDAVHTVLWL